MVLFNYATKEITAKIVYYGPGLCGKTTNLQFVYDSLPSNNKSKMLSLATKTDRTLFFDFLPLDLGKIRGMRTKLQLYTVPGQVYYNSTRQLVLKGADGIVFVADSQDFALDANLESLQNLEDNLKRQGIRIREIPVVIQYNKRDLANALPVAELNAEVNKLGVPHFESVATTGLGVEETLKGITQLVLAHLVKKYGLEGSEPLGGDIQILNPTVIAEPRPHDSLWDEDDPFVDIPPAPASAFTLDDAGDADDIPLVPTELIGTAPRRRSRASRGAVRRFPRLLRHEGGTRGRRAAILRHLRPRQHLGTLRIRRNPERCADALDRNPITRGHPQFTPGPHRASPHPTPRHRRPGEGSNRPPEPDDGRAPPASPTAGQDHAGRESPLINQKAESRKQK